MIDKMWMAGWFEKSGGSLILRPARSFLTMYALVLIPEVLVAVAQGHVCPHHNRSGDFIAFFIISSLVVVRLWRQLMPSTLAEKQEAATAEAAKKAKEEEERRKKEEAAAAKKAKEEEERRKKEEAAAARKAKEEEAAQHLRRQVQEAANSMKQTGAETRMETCTVVKHIGIMLLCMWDFVADVLQSASLCHNGHGFYEKVGIVAAFILGISFAMNFLLCQMWFARNPDILEVARTSSGVGKLRLRLYRLLACTNPEVLHTMLVMSPWAPEMRLSVQKASTDLKPFGVAAQLMEDVPQFIIGLVALNSRSPWVVINMVTKCIMLLFKLMSDVLNSIIFAGSGAVSGDVIAHVKRQEKRDEMCPEPTHMCQVVVQFVTLVLDWVMLVSLKRAEPNQLTDVAETLLSTGFVVLSAGFFLGLMVVLKFVREERESLWHCSLQPELLTVAVNGCVLDPAVRTSA